MVHLGSNTQILFGSSARLNASRQKYQPIVDTTTDQDEDHGVAEDVRLGSASNRPSPGSVAEYFFGFMYEEDYWEEDYISQKLQQQQSSLDDKPFWRRPVHLALAANLFLLSAASATAVTLVAAMSHDETFLWNDDKTTMNTTLEKSGNSFAARATAAAVLGTALGKLTQGFVPDVLGARRTSFSYALCVSGSLLVLALAPTPATAVRAQFAIEFFNAVQWPCTVVVLATHQQHYESGIFVTSLASRLGSLVGIPVSSHLLRRGWYWRTLALVSAWWAAVASSVSYFYVRDSVDSRDDPQNPVDPTILSTWFPDQYRRRKRWTVMNLLRLGLFVVTTNIRPSVQHIVRSATFWIVAVAHTGSSVVRTSDRVLGTYFAATNAEELTSDQAASLAVWHSVGTVFGLLIAGQLFAGRSNNERARKWMVSRLYMLAIASCYVLAISAVPAIHRLAPELCQLLQVMAVAAAGFGIAVPFYHIPSLVGASFGCDKGPFSSYPDGVAYGLASMAWKFVGNAVSSSGWAYGWAAVALLLILSALLMTEFMEHYFCRPRHGGTYETIILA